MPVGQKKEIHLGQPRILRRLLTGGAEADDLVEARQRLPEELEKEAPVRLIQDVDAVDDHEAEPRQFAQDRLQDDAHPEPLAGGNEIDLRSGALLVIAEKDPESLLDIDVQGVIQAKEKGSPGCFILILPPSMDELERRLSERGTEDPQALILRTQNAKNELSNWALYDYLVVNESLEQCIDDIATIIDAYRSSREVVIGELPWLKAIA